MVKSTVQVPTVILLDELVYLKTWGKFQISRAQKVYTITRVSLGFSGYIWFDKKNPAPASQCSIVVTEFWKPKILNSQSMLLIEDFYQWST